MAYGYFEVPFTRSKWRTLITIVEACALSQSMAKRSRGTSCPYMIHRVLVVMAGTSLETRSP